MFFYVLFLRRIKQSKGANRSISERSYMIKIIRTVQRSRTLDTVLKGFAIISSLVTKNPNRYEKMVLTTCSFWFDYR